MVNAPEGLNQVRFLPKTLLKTFAKLSWNVGIEFGLINYRTNVTPATTTRSTTMATTTATTRATMMATTVATMVATTMATTGSSTGSTTASTAHRQDWMHSLVNVLTKLLQWRPSYSLIINTHHSVGSDLHIIGCQNCGRIVFCPQSNIHFPSHKFQHEEKQCL